MSILLMLSLFAAALAVPADAGPRPPVGDLSGRPAARSVERPRIEASRPEVERWVSQLDSDSFAERESASRHLGQAGAAAIDPLAAAVDPGRMEVTRRAIGVLEQLCGREDAVVAQAAKAALAGLADSPERRIAARAAAALASQRLSAQRRAVASIENLGGAVYVADQVDGDLLISDLVLGKAWRGSDEDLKHLRSLAYIERLLLHGEDFTDASLEHLTELSSVGMLQLYGTRISDEGAVALLRALPDTRLDRRNGALLGVAGVAHQNGCKIEFVKAGSAADLARLEEQDVITSVDKKPVKDFEGLLAIISKKRAGDKIQVDFLRDDRRLSASIRLGELDMDGL